MSRSLALLAALLTLLTCSYSQGCGGYAVCQDESPMLSSEQRAYIAQHRRQGPAGLQAALADFTAFQAGKLFKETPLIEIADPAEAEARIAERTAERSAETCWQQIIDQVAAQRGAATSQLYWYTDLEQAKAAAAESGKPILSLRMLGKLTDEYSCANSRFFRTTLYTNKEISEALRTRFILHWQSVRPVPKVTIDFGDGRVLNRTLTGNSAHYVLSPQGEPLDVLPGLYSPQAFGQWLDRVEPLAKDYSRTHVPQLTLTLQRYHQSREEAILATWQADLARVKASMAVKTLPRKLPTAAKAIPIAVAKGLIEVPLLPLIAGDQRPDEQTSTETWQQIASLHRTETKLDASSVAVIRTEHEDAKVAMGRAMTKRRIEDPILKLVQKFEDNIALDTVKNEYLLHRQIHQWFASGAAPRDFDALNEKVYAELFLTPSSDPWLGLAPANVYTALENDGKVARSSRAE